MLFRSKELEENLKMFDKDFIKKYNTFNHGFGNIKHLIDLYIIILLILKKIYNNIKLKNEFPYNYLYDDFAHKTNISGNEYINDKFTNKICNNINVNGLDTVYLLYVNYEFDDINKSKPINQFVLHQTQQSVNSGKINSLTLFGTNTDTDMLFYDLIYSRLNVEIGRAHV